MAVREILQIGHPILAARADEVEVDRIQSAEVQGWIADMVDTMRDANGAGIAANQIGIQKRIFCVEVGENPRYPYKPKVPLTILVNPEIEFLSDETFSSNEGCLSVPQLRGVVNRQVEIGVRCYDHNGVFHEYEIRGYSACTWQHELDHLDGILFPHRVEDPRTFCSWASFQAFHQEAFAAQVAALVKKWGA